MVRELVARAHTHLSSNVGSTMLRSVPWDTPGMLVSPKSTKSAISKAASLVAMVAMVAGRELCSHTLDRSGCCPIAVDGSKDKCTPSG